MKRFIQSLTLVTLFVSMSIPAWSQASTEGKDFWLATTIICQPPTASNKAVPYIAISSKEPCVVRITDYQGNSVVTQHGTSTVLNQIPLSAGAWNEFGNTNAAVSLYDINPAVWYPSTDVVSAADVYKHADERNRYGLHVTSDKDISVYVIVRATNSMDASNILPVTAIQSEYYTQDYWPYAKDVSTNVTMSTILAIEDNTVVDITPKGDTYGKSNSGQTFNITLNKGETYYLMSKSGQQLAGTHIKARDDKKIAIYNGCPLTTVPVMVAARDGMYEQSMPVDYWGTDFIVTRSKHKDGNIVGITASNDGTSVYIDGYYRTTIAHAGDTYYCMLQSTYDPNSKKPGDKPMNASDVFTADVAYIHTSCPCAVYSYDTGNDFVFGKKSKAHGDDVDENENMGYDKNRLGDPSSVWISPIQQTIKEITFGTCYTDKTTMHYLNVVTETATAQQTTLAYRNGTSMVDCSNLLEWTEVPGNTKYSYARALISNNEPSKNVFTLKNPAGFIAHIYGNGNDESYAYSAGSAAVELGIEVEGETFTDGYVSYTRFCVGSELEFDANVGGKSEVTKVNWNFGDGITEYNSTPLKKHEYTIPGWYDVEAVLYGRQVCSDEDEVLLDTVKFSFRVVRPDTIRHQTYECVAEDYEGEMGRLDTAYFACDSVVITGVEYGKISSYEYKDTVLDGTYLNGKWYDTDGDYTWTIPYGNAAKCDSIITCHLRVLTCLQMTIPNDPEAQHICPGEDFVLQYSHTKGDIGEAHLLYGTQDVIIVPANGFIPLPTNELKPGIYNAQITVQDTICDQTLKFPIDLFVNYPSDIFKYKFNNVLAVYTKDYNGGYEFIGYQWYRNGEKIEGATSSVYHTEAPFTLGDVYYVVLMDKNGLELPSCPQTIEDVPDYNPTQEQAPASKHLINRQIVIRKGDQSFNVFGQRIQ